MEYPRLTTPSSQSPSGFVTIIHPHHPFCGQRVEIVRVRRGADPDLIVRLADGTHAAIAMSGTDYATSPEGATPLGASHLLDLEGLRQAAQLIEHLRQAGQFQETVS